MLNKVIKCKVKFIINIQDFDMHSKTNRAGVKHTLGVEKSIKLSRAPCRMRGTEPLNIHIIF